MDILFMWEGQSDFYTALYRPLASTQRAMRARAGLWASCIRDSGRLWPRRECLRHAPSVQNLRETVKK